MSTVTSIHDKFVRAILADKSVAMDYFKACLPKYIVDRLNLSTLTQLSDTYVSKELRKTMSDIVYSCSVKDSEEELKVCLLLEHKSRLEKFTPVQLGSYIFSGFQKQIDQEKRLSPIVPILLYHGKEKWSYRTLISLFTNLDHEFRPHIPDYEYIFHDLGEIPDQQLKLLENKFLQASLLALKYSQIKAELIKWIPTILSLVVEAERNLQTSLIVYTFGISGLKEKEIITLIEDVPVSIKSTVMITWDIFVEKGKKIGLEEGRQEGRQEKTQKIVRNLVNSSGLTDEQIARAAEVSIDYVTRIREQLE